MDATSSSCRSLLPATMPIGEFLLTLPQSAVVCEIGGGSSRKSRADWVIDIWTYDQATLQPGDRVSADRWIVHNVCTPGPWPVPDNAFDFTICSHLLEDIHDPFHVLSELMRVSPRGYVETPSRAWESARNPYGRVPGGAHHHWMVEHDADDTLVFTFKHGLLTEFTSFQIHRRVPLSENLISLYWDRHISPLRARARLRVQEDDFVRFRASYEGMPEAQVWRQFRREFLLKRVIYKALRTCRLR